MVLQSVPESDHRPEDEALRANSAGQSPLPGAKEGAAGTLAPSRFIFMKFRGKMAN